jgi:hypothetical protein
MCGFSLGYMSAWLLTGPISMFGVITSQYQRVRQFEGKGKCVGVPFKAST